MSKNIHQVRINGCSNPYIRGRISGIIAALSDDDRIYANYVEDEHPDVLVMRTRTTDKNWSKIKELIEDHYSGLCDFV